MCHSRRFQQRLQCSAPLWLETIAKGSSLGRTCEHPHGACVPAMVWHGNSSERECRFPAKPRGTLTALMADSAAFTERVHNAGPVLPCANPTQHPAPKQHGTCLMLPPQGAPTRIHNRTNSQAIRETLRRGICTDAAGGGTACSFCAVLDEQPVQYTARMDKQQAGIAGTRHKTHRGQLCVE